MIPRKERISGAPCHRKPSRRELIALGGSLGLLGLFPAAGCAFKGRPDDPARLPDIRVGTETLTLLAQEHPVRIAGKARAALPAWLYGEALMPVLRVQRDSVMTARLINHLPAGQHTTIHWHGIRLPNAMDGMPFLTQRPVYANEEFLYRFAPPDAGTYFFHPHCNTVEQLGRGLIGLLIVEDETRDAFDDDIVCVLKDWRVDAKGGFLPFLTLDGAANAGSFGALRTVNGKPAPVFQVPAGADLRLRVINADSTRMSDVGLEGAEAVVIAIDGNPLPPFPLKSWKLGPAMRLDLALRTGEAGTRIALVDYFGATPATLATFEAQGAARRRTSFVAPPLPPARFRAPELGRARRIELALSTGVEGAPVPPAIPDIPTGDGGRLNVLDALCLAPRIFWSMNGRPWPGQDHKTLPPPLFTLSRGETVQLSLFNASKHAHPIHLHGHSFRVLSASKARRPVHDADTVLVLPNERVEIAFAADNPGDWMIHCHIIEHQETGMMGWFRVS